jgi:hypothetical protein
LLRGSGGVVVAVVALYWRGLSLSRGRLRRCPRGSKSWRNASSLFSTLITNIIPRERQKSGELGTATETSRDQLPCEHFLRRFIFSVATRAFF